MSTLPPFLTDDEIRQIVTPLVQPAAIMRWFRTHGFAEARQKPNGMPLISRAYFDQVMGASPPASPKAPPRVEIDVAAYLAKFPTRAPKKPKQP